MVELFEDINGGLSIGIEVVVGVGMLLISFTTLFLVYFVSCYYYSFITIMIKF